MPAVAPEMSEWGITTTSSFCPDGESRRFAKPFEGTPSANMAAAVHVANPKTTVAFNFDNLLNAAKKLDGYQQINIYRTDGTHDANSTLQLSRFRH